MKKQTYDVVIIGGGVIGCAIARELSRYQLDICLIEKEEDVCSGTSKANSAIVHAGYDATKGTLKAKLNVEGNERMEQLAQELDFEFKRIGSMVVMFEEENRHVLQSLYERGVENGVKGLRILSGEVARGMEPNLSKNVVAALYAPTGGIVCPFGLTIALAENAFTNGVEFAFNTCVEKIKAFHGCTIEANTTLGMTEEMMDEIAREKKQVIGDVYKYVITTNQGKIRAKAVINAAGVYADQLHNMVSEGKLQIIARKGEYCLLDKEAGSYVHKTIFQLPGVYGKGVLVTPTVHANLLIGPTSQEENDKECTATSASGLDCVMKKASMSVDNLPFRQVITSFAGLRAHEINEDFVIGEVEDAKGFFDVAGIESPGLSAAPAIGIYVADMVSHALHAKEKKEFMAVRKGYPKIAQLPLEERARLIQGNPLYGNIVCRCENISEGEIVDAIRRPLGATSIDGIKRRTRAGMGRCQAGFCTPRTLEILSRELDVPMEDICKTTKGSNLVIGKNR